MARGHRFFTPNPFSTFLAAAAPCARRLFSSSSGELKALKLADSLDDTVWGCCMVNSRGFSDVVNGETVSLLVPLADMANHSLSPNAAYRFNVEQDAFEISALQVENVSCCCCCCCLWP
jgi:hypothetical protein